VKHSEEVMPTASDTGALVATCSCGACYTLQQFRLLPDGGVQDCGDNARLELRQCACRSHISIWVDEQGRLAAPPEWGMET
jgi:hypothetical protein